MWSNSGWGNTVLANNGGSSGDSDGSWNTSIVSARSDGHNGWQWAVSGVAGDGGVSPHSGGSRSRSRGRRRRSRLSNEQLDVGAAWEWQGVVASSIGNNNRGQLGEAVWVTSVLTREEVVVQDLSLVIKRKSKWGNSRAESQVRGERTDTELTSVLAKWSSDNLGVGVVVQVLSGRTNEEVVETSTLVHTVKVTDTGIVGVDGDNSWLSCNDGSGSESSSSESELHCFSDCMERL